MTGTYPAGTPTELSAPRPAMTTDEVLAGLDLSGHVSVVTGPAACHLE